MLCALVVFAKSWPNLTFPMNRQIHPQILHPSLVILPWVCVFGIEISKARCCYAKLDTLFFVFHFRRQNQRAFLINGPRTLALDLVAPDCVAGLGNWSTQFRFCIFGHSRGDWTSRDLFCVTCRHVPISAHACPPKSSQ